VTSRDKSVVRLSGLPSESARRIERMLDEGIARWNGKKPRGAGRRRPVKLRGPGKTMAEMVLADRGCFENSL
jgi:hypothetical protein